MTTSSFVSRISTWAFALSVLLSAIVGILIGSILGAAVSDLAGTSNTFIVVMALVGAFGPPLWLIIARRKGRSHEVGTTPADASSVSAEQNSATTPQLSRGMQIAIAVASIAAVAVYNFWPTQDPYGLETRVQDTGGWGWEILITNTKKQPIKIVSASVNDRAECILTPNSLPADLKEGDQRMLRSTCDVRRLNVTTDRGVATYSFK
jgi:F0F1-type ATP synthase assembly protein I